MGTHRSRQDVTRYSMWWIIGGMFDVGFATWCLGMWATTGNWLWAVFTGLFVIAFALGAWLDSQRRVRLAHTLGIRTEESTVPTQRNSEPT